ncbi:hypothetical protein [Phytoactinopolyspora limicola]|uniref:hypothetical protein n=1 Tax=Phytoactinopolyspora limicola TaxID=2715536 RepID=UPI00140E1D06|nr:hypothetical protein [Phytoactinopolyspora limicola]
MTAQNGKTSGHHPWGAVAFTAALIAGVLAGLATGIIQDLVNLGGRESQSAEPSAARTVATPLVAPTDGRNRIQELGLGISPGEISIAAREYTTIEITDATPNTYIDVEIAQPDHLVGELSGICPDLTEGPCHLVYRGGGMPDRAGVVTIEFPSDPDIELHPGLYEITAQDRHTAAVVSIDLKVRR